MHPTAMNQQIKINLQLAGAYFPLTIERSEEEIVREAARQVNMLLSSYLERYKNLDQSKALAMVAYQFALEKLQWQARNDTQPYTEKLEVLSELLDRHMEKLLAARE